MSMQVKTKLGLSTILGAGIGLFADEFIPAGTIVWKYDPTFDLNISKEQFQEQTQLYKEFLTTYCFSYNGAFILCVDNARFFNHSDNPNCYSDEYNEHSLGYTKAKRDIQIGEELLDDYSKFGLTKEDKNFNEAL
jgi:uncharacterized protein